MLESARGAELDAVRLALAQLRSSSGDVGEARPVLEGLARDSADPLVAARARELLKDSPANPSGQAPECSSEHCPEEGPSGTNGTGDSR